MRAVANSSAVSYRNPTPLCDGSGRTTPAVVIIDRDVSVAWQLCAERKASPLLKDEDTTATLQAAAPDSLTRARELLPPAGIGLHADLSGVCTKFRVWCGGRFCRCPRMGCRSVLR